MNTQKQMKILELDAIVHHQEVVVSQYGASTPVLLRGITQLLLWKGEMQQRNYGNFKQCHINCMTTSHNTLELKEQKSITSLKLFRKTDVIIYKHRLLCAFIVFSRF